MQPEHQVEAAAVLVDFLRRYEQDLAQGEAMDLAGYQALYPGHEALIEAEWPGLQAGEPLPEVPGYQIEAELGRGGQGRVYLARDERLGRRVALKLLPDQGPFRTRQLARLRREAAIAARIDHPGICTVFDSGEAGGMTYIAMQWIPGETLAARIHRGSPEDPEYLADRARLFELVQIFERTARAVHAAHEAGILHRDLKPGNLMISEAGDPVVLDFGLAREEELSSEEALTLSEEVFGTPVYMAPEQLRGEHARVDVRSDVYALGVSLYEALSLRPPFAAASRAELFRQILETEPPRLARGNRNLPRDLCTVVETAMAKDPQQRYRSAADLAEDLRRVREYRPIEASPPGPLRRAARWCQRNRAVAGLSGLLFVVLSTALWITSEALQQARADKRRLQDSLSDIEAGKLSRRQEEIRRLLIEGYQFLYSANPRRAEQPLRAVLDLDPDNVDAIAGRAWAQSEDPRRALEVLDASLQGLAEVPADLHWLRGEWLAAAGQTDAAAAARRRAGGEDSALRLYYRGLRAIAGFVGRVGKGQQQQALEHFRAAIRRSPQPQFHHFHSVLMCAARMGDRALMERAAADLEHHWPSVAGTHDAIAQFFLPIDRERALRSLRWLVQHTDQAAPFCGLAADALRRGDKAEALRQYDAGIARQPDYAPIWWLRGQLHQGGGRSAQARADFCRAIRVDPEQEHYLEALMGLHRREQSWARAVEDLESLRAALPEHAGLARALAEARAAR